MPPSVSVIILTKDEETNLPDCIGSLEGLPCDLFVVDSGSTDNTVHTAREHRAQVVEHPFENYAAQRNWAQANLPIETEWVLHIDADERLTSELVAEIKAVLADPDPAIDGFLLRKRTVFRGRWIRYGGHYPSYHLRLFRKHRGVCEDRLYDQHFVVHGSTAKLAHDYIDVLTADLDTWLQRHMWWAALEAREICRKQGPANRVQPALFGNPIERRRWLREGVYGRAPLFLRSFMYWIYRYFLRFGFLDGKQGFIFHFLQGFWFRVLVDIRIDDLRSTRCSKDPRND